MDLFVCLISWACIGLASGCTALNINRMNFTQSARLPEKEVMTRGQLVVHSNFKIPAGHRLFEELEIQRQTLQDDLAIPVSEEPIHVYLFSDSAALRRYMHLTYPGFEDRRAFFAKTETEMRVYAFWGDLAIEDLRHEVTHGYLHSALFNLPIWLDEGIAEYYEVPPGQQGDNRTHIVHLAQEFRAGRWLPNLSRIELVQQPQDFRQIDYAESWLWIHFLKSHSSQTRQLLIAALAGLRQSGTNEPLSATVLQEIPEVQVLIMEHLKELAADLRSAG